MQDCRFDLDFRRGKGSLDLEHQGGTAFAGLPIRGFVDLWLAVLVQDRLSVPVFDDPLVARPHQVHAHLKGFRHGGPDELADLLGHTGVVGPHRQQHGPAFVGHDAPDLRFPALEPLGRFLYPAVVLLPGLRAGFAVEFPYAGA